MNEYYKYVIDDNFGINCRLLLNPYLTLYGEVLLSTHIDNKETDSNSFIKIKDFGKVPSLRTIDYDEEILSVLKSHNILLPLTNKNNIVSNLETNIFDFSSNKPPLTEQDVYSMITAVKSINGIAMLKILPYKYADYKQFGSSKIKILALPLKDINYENIPLTTKVDQAIRNLKREKMKNLITDKKILEKNIDLKIVNLIENEEFTNYFELHDFFTIDSFSENGVKHLIKCYGEYNMNSSNIINDLKLMFKEMKIINETGYGFNLILSSNYLFVAPLINPYVYDRGIPIFADPYFFTGIFTLPIIKAEWPETLKGENLNFDFVEILRKSTN
jgi:hypothetical protein